jgi:hypothetical protein
MEPIPPPSIAKSVPPAAPANDPAFRDLKNNWDLALQRAESSLADMRAKHPDETHDDFLAARARPFDALLQSPPPSPPPPIPAAIAEPVVAGC